MAFPFIAGYVIGARNLSKSVGMAASAAEFRSQPATKVIDLSDRVDRLTMVIQALWELLRESGLTDEQLVAKIVELDKSDDVLDDTARPSSSRCPQCGAAVTSAEDHCQFCGHQMGRPANPFARI